MRYTPILTALFVLFLALPAPDAGAMTYDQLTAEMKAKGEAYKKKVNDMTVRQTMTMTEEGQTMTQKMVVYNKGKKSRMESEMNMPGMGKVQSKAINDGKDQWVYSDMTGGWSKMPGDENKQVDPGDWWGADDRKGKIVGEESVGGRDSWKVQFSDKNGSELVWVDKKEYFPLKTEGEGRDGKMETLFSDIRDSGAGFRWPHKMDMFEKGKKKGSLVIESMKINTGLSDSLFVVPKEAGSGTPNMKDMMKRFGGMMKNGGGE